MAGGSTSIAHAGDSLSMRIAIFIDQLTQGAGTENQLLGKSSPDPVVTA